MLSPGCHSKGRGITGVAAQASSSMTASILIGPEARGMSNRAEANLPESGWAWGGWGDWAARAGREHRTTAARKKASERGHGIGVPPIYRLSRNTPGRR